MTRKTKADRTGQFRNRKRAERKLHNRLLAVERFVKGKFRAIPREKVTEKVFTNAESKTFTEYQISPEEIDRLRKEISDTFSMEFLETLTDQMIQTWYWLEFIEMPYRQGTGESVIEANRLTDQAEKAGLIDGNLDILVGVGLAVSIPQYIRGPSYLARLHQQQARSFKNMSNTVSRAESEVLLRIFDGMKSGIGPKDMISVLSDTFDKHRSSMTRFANAEVNWAYNQAKLDAINDISTHFGYTPGVLHLSALLPGRTRDNHAARHGNVYSVKDQQEWWTTGANLINCKCSTISVLLDGDGDLVDTEAFPQKKTRESFKAEIEDFKDGKQPKPPFR